MGQIRLRDYDNSWYDPGRPVWLRVVWILVSGIFFQTWFPWPSRLKCALLRLFGASVGTRVVIKPRVTIKYPWNIVLGDDCWIGENVWLDSLARITLAHDVVLSQDCLIETGNHDWSKETFDLVVKPVSLEAGAWAAARSILLPGAQLANNSVLAAGSALSGSTEPNSIYAGVPARRVGSRRIG